MHTPQDEESKRLPFEEAASGAVALETLLPAALRLFHAGDLELPQLFRALSYNPAKRLGLAAGRMAAGAPAETGSASCRERVGVVGGGGGPCGDGWCACYAGGGLVGGRGCGCVGGRGLAAFG